MTPTVPTTVISKFQRETGRKNRVRRRKILGVPKPAIFVDMTENQTPSAAAAAAAATASVAVKLPEFWKSDPAMWFAQAEAQFALAGVVRDETKYYYIISKIDQSVICHVADLIQNPPADNKYKAVKDRLISRFEISAQGKLECLLNACDLGDMRPTHLLARMQELAAGLNISDDVMKILFLQRMPEKIKPILSISDGTLAIAEMADKMVETTPHVVAAASTPVVSGIDMSSLQEQIACLTAEIRRMKTSAPRSRSTSRSRRSVSSGSTICWYHRKFGPNAYQCREPCSYNASKN